MIRDRFLRLTVLIALLLFVWFVGVCNAADEIPPIGQKQLKVYEASTGRLVGADRASAFAMANGHSGLEYKMKVQATIPNTLSVSLSSTKVRWTIKKKGAYIAKIADIDTGGALVEGYPKVLMTVSGADHIRNETGKNLPTAYALTPFDPIVKDGIMPHKPRFIDAPEFNRTHELPKHIAVPPPINISHQGGAEASAGLISRPYLVGLWNRVDAKGNTSVGSTYTDEFTVTFSQEL